MSFMEVRQMKIHSALKELYFSAKGRPIGQSEILRFLDFTFSRSTVSSVLRDLDKEGLVKRIVVGKVSGKYIPLEK